MNHIFYDTKLLTIDEKRNVCNAAKYLATGIHIDELSSKSFHRVKSDLTYEEIIKLLEEDSHFVIINRKYFGDDYGEIGFSTNNSDIDYFLFIEISKDSLLTLVSQYNLKIK